MSNDSLTWQIADEYQAARAKLAGDDGTILPDISTAGYDGRYAIARHTLTQLDALDELDLLGHVLHERLTADIAMYECGFLTSLLAPLFTPVHRLRQVFDDLPRTSNEDWHCVGRHFRRAAHDYVTYAQTLRTSLDRGHHIAKRQVSIVADQCMSWIDPGGSNFYLAIADEYGGPSQALAAELREGAQEVTAAVATFVEFLRADLHPRATEQDGVGPTMYGATSRAFLGADVNLKELYDYGWSQLRQLSQIARDLGEKLTGESSLTAARAVLDARPGEAIAVGEALADWLQERLDRIGRTILPMHFELPEKYAPLEAKMSSAESVVMYYARPDEAGTRPGRVWWAVPSGVTTVPSWRQASTVHHEGIPGHHLQIVTAMGAEDLHPWQRVECHIPGYSEGWAHYAERLAIELGLLDDEAELLGVYDAQLWRICRIVVDLGLHLDLPIPADNGATKEVAWTPEIAATFMEDVAGLDPITARSEVARYLGWPGQALAFKYGSDCWWRIRERERARLGADFDQKAFHLGALSLGPMGLGTLESLYAGELG